MVKKIISVATAFLMLCCMIPFGVFADDVLDVCPKCGERTYSTWRDLSVEVADALGMPLNIKAKSCSNCGYAYYDWNLFGATGYKDFTNGGTSLIIDYLREWIDNTFGKNATATKFTAGGGSTDGSGVGRRPAGYADDNGTPSIGSNGEMFLVTDCININSSGESASYGDHAANLNSKRVSVSSDSVSCDAWPNYSMYMCYEFTAPIDGKYSYYAPAGEYLFTLNVLNDGKWKTVHSGQKYVATGIDVSGPTLSYTSSFAKGDKINVCVRIYGESSSWDTYMYNCAVRATGYPIIIKVTPLELSKKTNITINNNTWNGNIYVDNSNNLTYIYPQYTTINENN
ncbi:hypothetical protein, partial [Gemmiger sp.]